jgi:hypothetical protein
MLDGAAGKSRLFDRQEPLGWNYRSISNHLVLGVRSGSILHLPSRKRSVKVGSFLRIVPQGSGMRGRRIQDCRIETSVDATSFAMRNLLWNRLSISMNSREEKADSQTDQNEWISSSVR